MVIRREMKGRLYFAAALYVPTLLVFTHDLQPERSLRMALWALCASVVPASLPRAWMRTCVALTWVTLPATLWWMGYVVLNGIGPGWEAAQAALSSNIGEMFEAAGAVLVAPVLAIAVGLHVALLGAVTAMTLRKGGAPVPGEGTLIWPRTSRGVLLAALLPVAVSSSLTAFDLSDIDIFSPADSLASPMGSYSLIAQQGFEQVVYGEFFSSSGRRIPAGSRRIGEPVLSLLVVGESVRAGGIGPDRTARGPWTKKLDERFRSGLGAWLPTTCAGSNGTQMSVPLLLTGLPPAELGDTRQAPSGLAKLKSAGFATAWITNQDRSVFQEGGHDFYWSRPMTLERSHDAVMVPVLKTFAAPLLAEEGHNRKPRGAVVHMMGSHFEYGDRYPEGLFPLEPENLGNAERVELRYERSEEYGAQVLVKIAEVLDQSKVPAFAVFTADHGENLPGDRNGVLLHLGARTTLRDGTTSSLVMWNRAMAEGARPAKVLARVLGAPLISHQDVWHIWMALSGVEDGPVTPDVTPTIHASLDGKGYRTVLCSELKP
jgi:glucan phosphoethanolaminetransferase (alkaline phosphatase superfamily)